MINNNPFRSFYPMNNTNYTAQQLAEYNKTAKFRKNAELEGSGDESSFAAKLKKADEYLASGESCGARDSIGIILRQMDDPAPGQPVTKTVVHDGVPVVVTKDAMYGNSITIGGSLNPDWIQVATSVGTVNIDLNDMEGLSKCLDMFSPEDVKLIMRKILEVKQAREAQKQIDDMDSELVHSEQEDSGDGDSEEKFL